jgi:rubrerythrin
MGGLLRKLAVRALLPRAWGQDHHRAAVSLKRFGDVEADSAWQYHQALSCSKDTELKRMLFANMLEELDHADRFYGVAHNLSTQRLRTPDEQRLQLIEREDDLAFFLAYTHLSEKEIHGQFDNYAKVCGIKEVANIFHGIQDDEAGHESEARRFLVQVAGSDSAANGLIRRARLRRFKEAWLRASQSIGQVMFFVILSSVFMLFGALGRQRRSAATPNVRALAPQTEGATV